MPSLCPGSVKYHSFCWAIHTSALDFLWDMPWVSKPMAVLYVYANLFLRFTSSVTPAELLMAILTTGLFWCTYTYKHSLDSYEASTGFWTQVYSLIEVYNVYNPESATGISDGSRISPRGGREPSKGGAWTRNFAKFSQKLHEIERIWTQRGGRASLTPPLRSATGHISPGISLMSPLRYPRYDLDNVTRVCGQKITMWHCPDFLYQE